jgi:hypothetical protein
VTQHDPVITPIVATALVSAGTPLSLTVGAGFALPVGTAAIASAISSVALTAAAIGAQYLLRPKPAQNKPQNGQVTVRQSIPPRRRGYGRAKLGGNVVFVEAAYGRFYQALVHCEGEIDAIEEWWLNDIPSNLPAGSGGGLAGTGPWANHVGLESRVGLADQAPLGTLTLDFPGVWTTSHKLNGLACTVMKCSLPASPEKNFPKIYPQGGPPAVRVVARLCKVYDPRTGLTAWSDNAALVIRDFLTSPRVYAIPASRIDDASFSAFADLCANTPYQCWGTYELSEEPRAVLRELLATCDGELYTLPSGKIGIRGGKWDAPTVTITEDMVLAADIEQGNDRLAAFNRLKISYTSPHHDYQEVEAEPWDDEDNQALTGAVLTQDLSLPWVPSNTQARRLAKIAMAKGNPRWKLRLKTNLAALKAYGERTVRVTLPSYGIDEPFHVRRMEVAGDMSSATLDLASLDAAAYAFDTGTEAGTPPPIPVSTTVAATPPAVTGATAWFAPTVLTGGASAVQLRVKVATPSPDVWNTRGQIRKQGATDWVAMTAEAQYQLISGVLEDGATYEYQLSHMAPFNGTEGAWGATQTALVKQNLVVPSDDANAWPGLVRANYTMGGFVADPLGGTRARSLTFTTNDQGYYYATVPISASAAGRTWDGSLYLRKPTGGKNKITFLIVGVTSGEKQTLIVTLSSTWTRVVVNRAWAGADTSFYFGLDNRTGFYPSGDNTAGVLEVFGLQLTESGVTAPYWTRG